jgi:hypothetical protein
VIVMLIPFIRATADEYRFTHDLTRATVELHVARSSGDRSPGGG